MYGQQYFVCYRSQDFDNAVELIQNMWITILETIFWDLILRIKMSIGAQLNSSSRHERQNYYPQDPPLVLTQKKAFIVPNE